MKWKIVFFLCRTTLSMNSLERLLKLVFLYRFCSLVYIPKAKQFFIAIIVILIASFQFHIEETLSISPVFELMCMTCCLIYIFFSFSFFVSSYIFIVHLLFGGVFKWANFLFLDAWNCEMKIKERQRKIMDSLRKIWRVENHWKSSPKVKFWNNSLENFNVIILGSFPQKKWSYPIPTEKCFCIFYSTLDDES